MKFWIFAVLLCLPLTALANEPSLAAPVNLYQQVSKDKIRITAEGQIALGKFFSGMFRLSNDPNSESNIQITPHHPEDRKKYFSEKAWGKFERYIGYQRAWLTNPREVFSSYVTTSASHADSTFLAIDEKDSFLWLTKDGLLEYHASGIIYQNWGDAVRALGRFKFQATFPNQSPFLLQTIEITDWKMSIKRDIEF